MHFLANSFFREADRCVGSCLRNRRSRRSIAHESQTKSPPGASLTGLEPDLVCKVVATPIAANAFRASTRVEAALRTINATLGTLATRGNWLFDIGRLAVNTFARLGKSTGVDEINDVLRKRRALTEAELRRLLIVARLRPVAEHGRATVKADGDARPAKSRPTALLTTPAPPASPESARATGTDDARAVALTVARTSSRSRPGESVRGNAPEATLTIATTAVLSTQPLAVSRIPRETRTRRKGG
jgi:hypothetical protein